MSTKPTNDLGFAEVSTLAALAGCYENAGEAAKGSGAQLLSRSIWPKEGLDHERIDAVQVRSAESGTLRVAAISARHVVREETYVEGRDFTFSSGQIAVSRPISSAAAESGNPFIGGGVQTMTLGVDALGNGRQQNSAVFAGTVFLVIPIAGSVKDAVRFPKNEDRCIGR